MQVNPAKYKGLAQGLRTIISEEGARAIWLRTGKPVQTMFPSSFSTQLGVTFASGYLAGVVCAVVSHPADSIVSLMSKPDNKGKSVAQIARDKGAKRLFTGGLGTRVLMIGTLTGLQWWIYDSVKSAMGMGTTGGAAPVAAK
ncbi:hypothetical protein HDU89_007167 [Geranomyces variabilis]|nr:hypothetical protein HDU89_007167 [Geranomyces variabilis]